MLVSLTFVSFLATAPAPVAAAVPVKVKATLPEDAPISIDLKDVDITDVVRMLAEVGGLQVVMDPGVSCHLTLKLTEVPWPKVLDVALKTCRLGYEEDGGIVRVATTTRLLEETTARRKLEEERKLARPLKTTVHRLSYAKAEQMAAIVRKFLSPRGEVVVDARTNTLIITDVE
jgi:type II secretory pathway component HofQ